jgi:hypothetical protein
VEAKYLDQNVIIEAIPGLRTAYVSNEYVEALESRIILCEKTAEYYRRAITISRSYFERAKNMRELRLTLIHILQLSQLKMFIDAAMSQRNEDLHNNVNRYCSIPGDRKPRQWRVVFAMTRDEKGWPRYLVRSIRDCDEFRVVSMIQMTNLY